MNQDVASLLDPTRRKRKELWRIFLNGPLLMLRIISGALLCWFCWEFFTKLGWNSPLPRGSVSSYLMIATVFLMLASRTSGDEIGARLEKSLLLVLSIVILYLATLTLSNPRPSSQESTLHLPPPAPTSDPTVTPLSKVMEQNQVELRNPSDSPATWLR